MSRARLRTARSPGGESGNWGWKVLVGAVAAVMVVILVVGGEPGPRRDSDLCREDREFAAQFAVLLDPSDALSSTQRRSAVPRLQQLLQSAPEDTEIRVYTVAAAGRGQLEPMFRICAPLNPDSIGSFDPTVTRGIAEREYSEAFVAPLRQRLDALLEVPADTVSPIVEAMQATAVDAFQPRTSTMRRQLVIVSDMVQHSRDLSFFREPPDFVALSRHPDYRTLRVGLERVQVTVLQLQRRGQAGQVQIGPLRHFWEDFLIDQSAGDLTWIEIEG